METGARKNREIERKRRKRKDTRKVEVKKGCEKRYKGKK
jgi:hypothetical protein